MIGFIRRSDVPVLIIGIVIAVPLTIMGMFTLLKFFPDSPEGLALFVWLCLMGISIALAYRIRKWIRKNS